MCAGSTEQRIDDERCEHPGADADTPEDQPPAEWQVRCARCRAVRSEGAGLNQPDHHRRRHRYSGGDGHETSEGSAGHSEGDGSTFEQGLAWRTQNGAAGGRLRERLYGHAVVGEEARSALLVLVMTVAQLGSVRYVKRREPVRSCAVPSSGVRLGW
jgi:hypothetical protein